MAITPTGAIYKTLTFDGVSSADYGVYITGQAVYNAPQRDVEMINIPGRNGAFELDKGRFQNIEVTYKAGIFAKSESEFAQTISAFRNFLCSRLKYCQLTDDYNSGEFRMAVYKSGLEVTPAQLIAGEFDIVFECQPQRFLFSGQDTIEITSGDDIVNPTLFPSRPLLEVTGYGSLILGGETITVHNEPIGEVVVYNSNSKKTASAWTIKIDTEYALSGDTITIPSCAYGVTWKCTAGPVVDYGVSISSPGSAEAVIDGAYFAPAVYLKNVSFQYGTFNTISETATFSIEILDFPNYRTVTATIEIIIDYNGADEITLRHNANRPVEFSSSNPVRGISDVILDSTKSALGNPLYIDLDIGEAYLTENDITISANNGVEIPPDLPTIPPGISAITFDNTITDLKLTPRWWRI